MESRSPDAAPAVRGSVILGFRTAAVELWGDEGLRQIAAALPDETRRRTVDDLLVTVDWVPVSFVIDWHTAVWGGPAERRDDSFYRYVDRSVDHGFGRFRRAFLKLVTPAQLASQAPTLWRHQHTHGDLQVTLRKTPDGSINGAMATLRDHPFAKNAISRRALVEAWRHVITLARVKDVRASHYLDGEAVVARFTWGAGEERGPDA